MSTELGVIVKAKELAEYIFLITEKSPKKYRGTFTSRLHNFSLELIENLFYANSIRIGLEDTKVPKERLDYQRRSKVTLDLLCTISELTMRQQCIQMKHYKNICQIATDVRRLLYAWAKSDQKRVKKNNIN